MTIISDCRAGNRCRKWRECHECAKIRQAQIANVAEIGAFTSPRVTYAVARTYSQATINADKAAFMKRLKTITEGGIWTIETGDIAGLHLNIIAGSSKPIDAGQLATMWPTDADFWASEVEHSDVRRIAAYSSKNKTMPRKEEYSGKLYGSFGTWKRPLALIAEQKQSLILTGLALEKMLEELGVPELEDIPIKKLPELVMPYSNKATMQERKTIIKEHGKDVEKAIMEHEREKSRITRENHLRRLLTIHRDEIELKGYVYVAGWGLLDKSDLEKNGFDSIDID